MNKERQIEKFISNSIKKKSKNIDVKELTNLLAEMSTEELQMFWMRYSSSKALSRAQAEIADWKTKEQEKYFLHLTRSYQYESSEKDTNGKYIVDKIDLITHITNHINNIIQDQIQLDIELKNKSFLEKMPYYLMIFSLILIPFFFIGSLIPNKIGLSLVLICCVTYLVIFISYLIVHILISQKYKPQAIEK